MSSSLPWPARTPVILNFRISRFQKNRQQKLKFTGKDFLILFFHQYFLNVSPLLSNTQNTWEMQTQVISPSTYSNFKGFKKLYRKWEVTKHRCRKAYHTWTIHYTPSNIAGIKGLYCQWITKSGKMNEN